MNDLKMYARMGLRTELDRLDARRAELMALMQQLGEGVSQERPRKRRMSAEGRERIREAVQRRWARVRAEQAPADAPATTQEQIQRAGGKPAASRRAVGNRKK